MANSVRIGSTLWAPGVPAWADVDVIDRRLRRRLAFARHLASVAGDYDVLVLNGAARFDDLYQDLLAAMALSRQKRPPALVIAEAAWDAGSARLVSGRHGSKLSLGRAAKAAVRAIDGSHVTYCVFSDEDRSAFVDTFGVSRERVAVTRLGHTLWSRVDEPAPDGGYVFAGGDSLRDYDVLVEAVRDLSVPVRIATSRRIRDLPPHVAIGRVAYDDYTNLIRNADVVVTPLRKGPRSAGLLTYLNAMAMGKLAIVSDACGVREYVTDGETGLVVPPSDPRALRDAIRWALDPANADRVRTIRAQARRVLKSRSPRAYWERLREVAATAALRDRGG